MKFVTKITLIIFCLCVLSPAAVLAANDTISCGNSDTCTKIDETCAGVSDCDQLGGGSQVGTGVCVNGYCYLNATRLQKYNQTEENLGVTSLQQDLQIKKPIININIPQLNFSDVQQNIDEEGYLYLPWISEYVTAIYKFGIAVVSIVAVIIIIFNGARIVTSAGGENKNTGYKKIVQAVIGLFIAWGSYFILFTINPDLVNFRALKVQYVKPIEEILSSANTDADAPSDANSANCEQYDELFKKYASCLGADWNSFKAVAAVETNCKANSKNASGYIGLFQTNEKNCTNIFNNSKYSKFASFCTKENIIKPEFSIAYFTQMQKNNVAAIKKYCPYATPSQQGFALHAYHNVPVGGKAYIRNGCKNYNDFTTAFVKFYTGTTVMQNTKAYAQKFSNLLNNETAFLTAVGNFKMEYARDKAGPLFQSLGGNLMADTPSEKCPLDDPNLTF